MTARREHRMAFGAALLPSGGVCFSLWAPAAEKVSLCLDSGDNKLFLPMPRQDEGWFRLETEEASRGSRYCFQLASGLLVPDPASRFQPSNVHGPSEVITTGGTMESSLMPRTAGTVTRKISKG